MALVLKSEDGAEVLIMDRGFCASRVNEKWVHACSFNPYEIAEFYRVFGSEADALCEEAHTALRKAQEEFDAAYYSDQADALKASESLEDQVKELAKDMKKTYSLLEQIDERLRQDEADETEEAVRFLEARAEFLDYCANLIDYWDSLPEYDQATGRKVTQKDRISGVVFSLLVALDGGAAIGPYNVRKILSDQDGNTVGYGPDIAGSLHELLGRVSS